MEQWEVIVERPLVEGHSAYEKILQTAAAVLNNATHLAAFETEWVMDTLLYAPVHLVSTVSRRRGDDAWAKALADALKLLTDAVGSGACSDKHYDHIVDLCLLSYEGSLRALALVCLAAAARRTSAGARAAPRHVAALAEATHCRAPLALLVGALCEHHPAAVCDDVTAVWRGYLNMLDNTKNTDTVIKAVLEGVSGLFKHFGDELPTAELAHFYDNLTNIYIKKPACQAACFSILLGHCSLFRERVCRDRALRELLWDSAADGAPGAALSVYTVVAQCVDRTTLKKILTTEVFPRTQSPLTQTKLTALRVLAATKTDCFGDLSQLVDMHTLEHELRNERVSYADAETVLWCVEYNIPNSERLLLAAILFYDNLPPAFRKKIVVTGVVNSLPDVKRAVIQFLISCCCDDADCRLWRDLNDADDAMLLVARELADCLVAALEAAPEDETEEPAKLTALLRLASKVSLAASAALSACVPLLVASPLSPAALAAARAALTWASVEHIDSFYKSVRISSCRDEATLHEASLTLAHAPDDVDIDAGDMLTALQIIFSSDVEPKTHGVALRKLDHLLTNDKCLHLDTSDTIRSVEKLRARGDRADREIRILHREVTMFLGKHGNADVNNNRDGFDDAVIVDLKKSLNLVLPGQGTPYKLDVRTLLLLALQHEDPGALLTLLAMLCSNLVSSNKEQSTQRAVIRVVRALARAHAAGCGDYTEAIETAVRQCGDVACGTDLLLYISNTQSCGVRKLLSTALSALCEDPDMLQLTVERTSVMLMSSESTIKRAGLDIAETILSCLENNNTLSKTILPELTVLIAKTNENNSKAIFDIASKTFIDKKELFDEEVIKETCRSLLENILKNNLCDVKIYKTTVKMSVGFIKNLRSVKLDEILNAIFDICKNDMDVRILYVLSIMKSEFGFDNDVSRRILGRENSRVVHSLFSSNFNQSREFFGIEAVLRFIEEYCEGILELKYQETVQLLSEIITKLTPELVKELHKTIKTCFTSLYKHLKSTPKQITSSFQTWVEKLPIKKINEAIDREHFLTEYKLLCVEALKLMSNVFDIREMILSDVKSIISRWPSMLLKLYSQGRLEDYFSNEIPYFIDILTVSLKFLTVYDIKEILKSSVEFPNKKNTGILFASFFMEGFFDSLTEKPFILLDEDVKEASVVLNDIVRLVLRKPSLKERSETVLELVDKLWPAYIQHATFTQKYYLLTNLECLGPGPDSNPLRWVVRSICSREVPLDDRIKLLAFVPEEAFKSPEVTSAAACLFPARLGELRPALLDAVAARPAALLSTLAALSAGDTSAGWWDSAVDACLSAAAKRISLDVCVALLDRSRGERVVERVLVPLVRHSSAEFCERFLAPLVPRILSSLKKRPRGDTAHAGHEQRLDEYLTSLHLLLLAYEKLPTWSLELPSSILYSALGPTVPPWYLVREGCKLCHSLWDVKCPPTASDRLRTMYRKLECLLYNSLCAGVCRRRPTARFYEPLFSEDTLQRLVDEHHKYELPIRASWLQRTKALPVAVPVESSTLSLSHTQRSRIFLRTLSEDPMLFDLHTPQEEAMETQDISLSQTPLNSHPSAATLTALFRHAAGLPALAQQWTSVASVLAGGRRNLRWLLAQIICNCREELKPHASVLLPGLLAVLAQTVDKCMNGLHVDVLETILYWKEETASDELNIITHHLITTCMENRRRNVFDGLLKTLQGLLELYGSSIRIEWKSFEPYYEDTHRDTQKALFQLIRLICRHKIYIPQILSKILAKDADPSKMAECFGLALAACQDDAEKQEGLGSFKKYLAKCGAVTSYVRVLYYASLGCAECCGEQEFRKITDYVTKVTSQDRAKCLRVLSSHLSRPVGRCQYARDMFDTVHLCETLAKDLAALQLVKTGLPVMSETLRRRCVALIAALSPAAPRERRLVVDTMSAACEDLFSQPTQPPAKRQKTETTVIFSLDRDDVYINNVLTCLGLGAVDVDADVAKAAREALGARLDKDLGARFAECFLLCVYMPAHSDRPLDVCVCVCAMLEMLYSELRQSEGFRSCKLREESLPIRESAETSKLLTLSKSFQGTFSSYGATRGRTLKQKDTNKPAIDVQVTIDNILENLLEFAKSTPDAARALLTEVLRSVLSAKFDVTSALVPLLSTLLGREPADLTPLCIDLCRVLVKQGNVQGLLSPVERLLTLTAGTEGEPLVRLLYEELSIKCMGDELFRLGTPGDFEDVAMSDDTLAFSIEDMKSAFGKLSNWEELTLQQRRAVKNSLPPLWTDRKEFVACLDSYEVPANAQCWFDKMAAAYKQEMGPKSVQWLRKMGQWPRRRFETSAITEATSWRHEPSEAPPSHLFNTSDCLAEWAARLMIRSAYYNSLQHNATDDDKAQLSRSHELKWCMRANEMGVSSIALQCVDRNVEELRVSETQPWLRQKLLSLRGRALERQDSNTLRNVLKKAETCIPELSTDPITSIEMYQLMLLLHKDLRSLTHRELQTILTQVDRSAKEVDWSKSPKQSVSSAYETAMAHYDEALDEGTLDAQTALASMAGAFCRAASLGAPSADMLLAMLLRRLDESPSQLPLDAARRLIDQISPLVTNLDTFTLELLEKNSSKFPPELRTGLRALLPKDPRLEKYRRCLQLVCDPFHLMLHYCEELVQAVRARDADLWKTTFDRMKHKIYENPYAGPSYKLLDKYKADLYGIYDFEPTPEFAAQAETTLKPIVMGVRRPALPTLRVSDLCPALLTHAGGMGGLLGSRRVLRVCDTVQVFTDSIRRPVVISMLLSNGKTHRVIQKTGERLAGDAAAQRVAACTQRLCGAAGAGAGGCHAYSVTLLDEETALIEFLEGHERLRSLISSTCDLEVAHTVSRPADRSLAESPAAALQAHRTLCEKVPAHALRSALELNSSCVQDFILKKRTFTESLTSMTILTWLLGVSDRHLQNIMCGRSGAVVAVDWGRVWAREPEPPARLTRALLAAATPQLLEARLQSTLEALRRSARLLEACVRVAFHWASLDVQLRHLHDILRGATTSYQVSRDVITRDERLRHRDKHVALLDAVFEEFPHKEHYSVEDQVCCLLRHCTAPEILSVTRAGWEPWV